MPRRRPASRSALARPADALNEFLREETSGGKLLLAATALALLWANLAGDAYADFWNTRLQLGPGWLHLDLTLGGWAADGLLALFFFVAGIEVKRELTVGELSHWRAAALPGFAAAGGVALPAIVVIVVSGGAAAHDGAWAIPVATDIAFALGVLALAGSALPTGVRAVLLSMAVLDDLVAIALIALLFTSGLDAAWLAGAAGLCAVYALLQGGRRAHAAVLVAIGLAVWICVHASGVHATVAGVALGLLTPVRAGTDESESPGERIEHRLHPLSAGFVVPLFALSAAGISLGAIDSLGDPIPLGIVAGLLVGKTVGIFGGAWLAVRLRLGALPDQVRWADVLPLAVLGGIGYTVSLLIAGLAFDDVAAQDEAAAAVLVASTVASIVAVILLRRRPSAGDRCGVPPPG